MLQNRYFVTADGVPLGNFQVPDEELEATVPEGAVEVPTRPNDPRIERWNGSAWVPDLAKLKEARCDEVDALRDQKLVWGFSYASKAVRLNTTPEQPDVSRLIASHGDALASALLGQPWDANSGWIADDNSLIATPTAQDMLTFAKAAFDYQKAIIFAAVARKAAIRALATVAEVLAYDIEQGW